MFTYEANITCSIRDCVSIATGDTHSTPEGAQCSAIAQAQDNGWLVSKNGNAYCPHHHAESRLCPDKHPPSGCLPCNEFLTPRQTDLILELVKCLFVAAALNSLDLKKNSAEEAFKVASELMDYSPIKQILCDLTKYPNT